MDPSYRTASRALSRAFVGLAMSAVVAVVTLAFPDWIELVFHVDPDHGSGWFEWALVGPATLSAVASGMRTLRSGRALRRLRRAALVSGTD